MGDPGSQCIFLSDPAAGQRERKISGFEAGVEMRFILGIVCRLVILCAASDHTHLRKNRKIRYRLCCGMRNGDHSLYSFHSHPLPWKTEYCAVACFFRDHYRHSAGSDITWHRKISKDELRFFRTAAENHFCRQTNWIRAAQMIWISEFEGRFLKSPQK